MAVPKIGQLCCIILYICIFVISFFIIAPIGASLNKHSGQCLLYAKTSYGYGLLSTCNFCIAMAVMFCMLYGLVQAVLAVLIHLGKLANPFTEFKMLIVAIVEAVIFVLVFITACIISVGFKTLCDSIQKDFDGACSEMHIRNSKDNVLDTEFYTMLSVAQGGAWIAFFLWLGKLVLNVLTLRAQGNLKLPCFPQPHKPKEEPELEKCRV